MAVVLKASAIKKYDVRDFPTSLHMRKNSDQEFRS